MHTHLVILGRFERRSAIVILLWRPQCRNAEPKLRKTLDHWFVREGGREGEAGLRVEDGERERERERVEVTE